MFEVLSILRTSHHQRLSHVTELSHRFCVTPACVRTGGRKRDATEGGTREIGLVEYPPAVKANRVEMAYPIITMDLMATVLDILGE
jgi:hypothetical protein